MTITIKINTDNAAFEDSSTELADILMKLRNKTHGYTREEYPDLDGLTLHDTNGNTVGTVTVRGK